MSASANIHLRTTDEIKSVISRAAEASGSNLTQFVLDRVVPEAREIVAAEHQTRLSPEDWATFEKRLDEPPRDIPALREFLNQKPKFW